MVSFSLALVHKIISMACILSKMQKQLRPQWTTPTLNYLCEQRNGCVTALTRQPLPTKDWAWSRTSPSRICGGQTGIRAGFSLSILVLPWQYHSDNNSYLLIHPSLILYNVFNQHTYNKCNTQTSKLCNPILTILLLHICTVQILPWFVMSIASHESVPYIS